MPLDYSKLLYFNSIFFIFFEEYLLTLVSKLVTVIIANHIYSTDRVFFSVGSVMKCKVACCTPQTAVILFPLRWTVYFWFPFVSASSGLEPLPRSRQPFHWLSHEARLEYSVWRKLPTMLRLIILSLEILALWHLQKLYL